MRRLNLIGEKYGRLTVVAQGPMVHNRTSWVCLCDCGIEVTVRVGSIRSGNAKSCGCLQREAASASGKISKPSTRKGVLKSDAKIRHPLYAVWNAMKGRCNNPNEKSYPNYGGRGITVCERWSDFDNFVADMGERPEGTSLDRIDNDKGYSPDNCRWATPMQQSRNRRCNVLDDEDVSLIRLLLSYGMTPTEIGNEYGLGASRISHIKHSHSWRAI